MRVSYSGNTSAFQADAESSILSTRSKLILDISSNLQYNRIMTKEIYVSGDIEADGRIPGRNSMMSYGCAAFTLEKELVGTISHNLFPLEGAVRDPEVTKFWDRNPAAWQAATTDQVDPKEAMVELNQWVNQLKIDTGLKPIFVGFPATFDFMWMNWYLNYFANSEPFGFSAFDMKSYAAAYLKKDFSKSVKRNFPRRWFDNLPHTHIALDDALEQGAMAINMIREIRGMDAISAYVDKQ